MIRLRPLRPRETRNLRHWAMELVVVVVGVVLALWAQAWFEHSRRMAEVAEAEQAVREEVAHNMAVVAIWDAKRQCYYDESQHIREKLFDRDEAWPGIQRDALYAGDRVMLLFPYHLRTTRRAAWDAAQASGLASAFDPKRLAIYRDAYFAADEVATAIAAFREAAMEVNPILYRGPLSWPDRRAALGTLMRLTGAVGIIHLAAMDQREWYGAIPFGEAELKTFDEVLSESTGFTDLKRVLPCYQRPTNFLREGAR